MGLIKGGIMNKDTRKIYKRLEKDLSKNKPKLIEVCKKYIESENDNLLPDIEYLCNRVYEDSQDRLLILIATNEEE